MNKIYKFQDGGNTYIGQNPNPTWYNKANSFLNNNPWGGVISSGIDLVGGLIKLPPGYSGKKGGILAGLDKTYDAAANAIMAVPGWGTVAGLGMKALGVLNKGMQRLGSGTDGMTTADAILNSNFLGLTPLGLINGFGGKKANSYTRNQELDAASGAGFGGFQALQNTTQVGAGKKYGLFSSGARHKLDKLTEYTQGVKHSISGIVDTNTLNNLASQTSSPYAAAQFLMDLNGGMLNLRAARRGMKFPTIKLPKFKLKFYDPFKATLGEDWEEMYDADGVRTAIPSTLSTAQKQGLAPIPTKRGGIVYMKADGSFSSTPLYNSLYAKNGGQFIKNVISKYQAGNSLRRSVQVFDVATNKYVLIEIPLNKDLIAGRLPIRLANGTAVFMNGDGTVTSDRWETLGRREHLTPKGLEGMKTEDLRLAKLKGEEPIDYMNDGTPLYIKGDSTIGPISKTGKDNLFLLIEESNANFAKRLKDPNRKAIKLSDGTWGNFKLAWSEDETGVIVYPEIQEINGKLVDLSDNRDAAWKSAIERGDYIYFPSREAAEWFTTHYKEYYKGFNEEPESFKQGGKMNVIPEGALHARKNHLSEIDDMYKLVTHKGIPVITIEDGGEVVLHAEVEHSEIIFTKEVTDKMESYRKQGTDEAAIECGKMLVKEILYNTDDRSGVIQTVE